jgi:hypothetical protein
VEGGSTRKRQVSGCLEKSYTCGIRPNRWETWTNLFGDHCSHLVRNGKLSLEVGDMFRSKLELDVT